MLSIFSCGCWLAICLLWRNVCLGLLPVFLIGLFVFLIVSCVSANIFSHLVGCFLHFIYGLLYCAKVFKFDQVPFIYFCLFLLPWETDFRKYCYNLCQECLPMFSSRVFIVSCPICWSLNHFEFIFVQSLRECYNFIDSCLAVQLFQCPSLKRLSCLIVYSCHFGCRLIDHRCVGLLLGPLFCCIDLHVCFCACAMLF